MTTALSSAQTLKSAVGPVAYFLLRPVRFAKEYQRADFRPDLVAGLTVGVILLPQAVAFSLIAELPPEMGLYAAIVGAIFGALWGSSNQNHTGPANAISLLVLSSLQTAYVPGSPEFIVAAGLLAVMAGVFQLVLGVARLGILVNFVSHSVIVGFTSGAGLLIVLKQLGPLLGITVGGDNILGDMQQLALNLPQAHLPTALVGIGVIILLVVARRVNPKFPAALAAMILASGVVFLFHLEQDGVAVIGSLPRNLPPLADLPLFDLRFIRNLSAGALAVGAIGLVETLAIGRSIATQTNQRLDNNQEFVGQGMANIFTGLFSGYPVAGSFSRSAVNFSAGARTPMASLFSALVVVVAMFFLAPMATYLPVTALAGVLVVTGFRVIDRIEIVRIWQGTRGDAIIMLVTFLGTLFLHIETAVLMGILLSLVLYLLRTSTPRVHAVLPDRSYRHFHYQPDKPACPQLTIIDILGDLYFGAVSHVEEAILAQQREHPEQRFLLMRMHNVNHCDFSGIHMLESLVRGYRDRGGDVFMVRVSYQVMQVMQATTFDTFLGEKNFLDEDGAISYVFQHVLDPAVCIYECPVRVFKECQNLPKRLISTALPLEQDGVADMASQVTPRALWELLHANGAAAQPLIVDVREPREFHRGHIPGSELLPLPELLTSQFEWPPGREIIFVCRSGRRSQRAAHWLQAQGHQDVKVLQGGILAWESAHLLEAVD
ncbi:MAG: STAS domain-containing protein [Anaerolineales bacterium]|nr:STAS domain-containing protein [Anaerolineales bacterium]